MWTPWCGCLLDVCISFYPAQPADRTQPSGNSSNLPQESRSKVLFIASFAISQLTDMEHIWIWICKCGYSNQNKQTLLMSKMKFNTRQQKLIFNWRPEQFYSFDDETHLSRSTYLLVYSLPHIVRCYDMTMKIGYSYKFNSFAKFTHSCDYDVYVEWC